MGNASTAILRSMGKNRQAVTTTIAFNVINVCGNAILIYGFHLGVAGAAISTTFSRMVFATSAVRNQMMNYTVYYCVIAGIMLGALAMSLSSFCVVTNALQLNRFKAKQLITMNTITIKVDGMMCPHCEARVKKTLEALPEVESALVSHESGTAVLTLKEDISDAKLKEIIEDAGYTVI